MWRVQRAYANPTLFGVGVQCPPLFRHARHNFRFQIWLKMHHIARKISKILSDLRYALCADESYAPDNNNNNNYHYYYYYYYYYYYCCCCCYCRLLPFQTVFACFSFYYWAHSRVFLLLTRYINYLLAYLGTQPAYFLLGLQLMTPISVPCCSRSR